MKRGDVILVRFPHPSGIRGKKRPAVVIQADAYGGKVSTIVVAEVTTNVTMAGDPACLFIDIATSDGKATGLIQTPSCPACFSQRWMRRQSLRFWVRCRRVWCRYSTIA